MTSIGHFIVHEMLLKCFRVSTFEEVQFVLPHYMFWYNESKPSYVCACVRVLSV